MSTTEPRLDWGYHDGLAGATCAWGARWIITQDGYIDQLPDRMGAIGTPEEKEELFAWLKSDVKGKPHEVLKELLRSYQLSTREFKEVVLYEDERGIVLGSPKASAGYFYVVARFKS